MWVYGIQYGVTGDVAVVAVDADRKKVLYRMIPKYAPSAPGERGPLLGPEQEGDLGEFRPIPGQAWKY
jgi:hypothetical protein